MIYKTLLKKLISVFILCVCVFAVSFVLSKKALAETICTPEYGGGQTCVQLKSIRIYKEVSFKEDGNFSSRVKGAEAKQTVYFRITVKNEGDTDFENLKVEDDLPKYLKTNDDTEWTIKKLASGKEWSEVFKAEVVDEDDLPDSDTCVVNEARVKESNKTVDEDTAVVCIEAPTKVLGVKELPVTGASNHFGGKEISLAVMALGMLFLGMGLKKFI